MPIYKTFLFLINLKNLNLYFGKSSGILLTQNSFSDLAKALSILVNLTSLSIEATFIRD